MASVTKNYIAINTLYGRTDSQTAISSASAVYYGGQEVRRVYATDDDNNISIVWDVWEAVLSAENFTVPAIGVENILEYLSINALVDSYGLDKEGVKHELSYTVNVSSISANAAFESKIYNITLTQTETNQTITITCTQEANAEIGYTYSEPIFNSASMEQVGPEGGTAYLYVNWTQSKVTTFSNGTSSTTSLSGSSEATILAGTPQIDSVSVYDGGVSVPSAGTTIYSDTRTVFNVTSYKFTANGKTKTITGASVAVKQEANSVSYSYATPTINAKYTDVTAGGAAAILTISYSQVRTNTYTSGSKDTNTLTGTIQKAATTGNRITAISGTSALTNAALVTTLGSSTTGNVTAPSLNYTTKARTKIYTVSVTVSINNKTAQASLSVYQSANVVDIFYAEPTVTSVSIGKISAAGGTVTPTISWSQIKTTTSTAKPDGKSETLTGTITPSSISGTVGTGKGSVTNSNSITAASRGTTTGSEWLVYTITSMTFTVNDIDAIYTSSVYVYQVANTVTYSYATPSLTAKYGDVSAAGSAASVTLNYTQTRTNKYTSGSSNTTPLSGSVSKTATSGTAYISKILGTSYLTGASLITTLGQSTSGNVSASSLAYTSKARTKIYNVVYTIFVNGSSGTVSVDVYQAANSVTVTYENPTYSSLVVGTIPANGSSVSVSVNIKQNKHTVSTAIPTGKVEGIEATVTPNSITGTSVANNGRVTSDVKIAANTCGTTVTAVRTVFTITGVTFSYNGLGGTGTPNVAVKQQANVRSITKTTYSLSATAETTSPTAAAGNVSISVKSTRVEDYSYTSGSTNQSSALDTACTASTNRGTLTNTSLNGTDETTLQISKNISTTATVSYVVTFNNGTTKTVTITQQKDAVASSNVVVSRVARNASFDEALPDGTDATVVLDATVVRRNTYYSGATSDSTSIEQVTITKMTASSGTVSGNKVVASNLGTTYKAKTKIATITKIEGTVAGGTVSAWTGTLDVYQKDNDYTTTYGTYQITTSVASGNLSNTKTSFTITASCYRSYTNKYDSGSSATGEENGTATLTATNCSTNVTSITGRNQQVTVSVAENLGDERTCSVKFDNGSVSKTVSKIQNAVAYTFTSGGNKELNATATSTTLTVNSTRNGSAWNIAKSNISVTSGNATIGTVSSSGITTSIPITFTANTAETVKTITVKVTQPGSGNTLTITVILAAVPKPTEVAAIELYANYNSSAMTKVDYSIRFDATDVSKYGGGKLTNVVIQTRNGPSLGDTLIQSYPLGTINVTRGTATNYYNGQLNGNGQVGIFILVVVNNVVKYYNQLEEYMPEG